MSTNKTEKIINQNPDLEIRPVSIILIGFAIIFLLPIISSFISDIYGYLSGKKNLLDHTALIYKGFCFVLLALVITCLYSSSNVVVTNKEKFSVITLGIITIIVSLILYITYERFRKKIGNDPLNLDIAIYISITPLIYLGAISKQYYSSSQNIKYLSALLIGLSITVIVSSIYSSVLLSIINKIPHYSDWLLYSSDLLLSSFIMYTGGYIAAGYLPSISKKENIFGISLGITTLIILVLRELLGRIDIGISLLSHYDPIWYYVIAIITMISLPWLGVRRRQKHESEINKISENTPYFFTVSACKLIVMSIFTFNMYSFYWFYKNWKLIKLRTGANILPFWRIFFHYIWVYSCFKQIKLKAIESKINTKFPLLILSLLYVALAISPSLEHLFPTVFPKEFLYIYLLSFIPIIYANKTAVAVNKKFIPEFKNNSRFSVVNWVAIAGGLLILLAIITTTVLFKEASKYISEISKPYDQERSQILTSYSIHVRLLAHNILLADSLQTKQQIQDAQEKTKEIQKIVDSTKTEISATFQSAEKELEKRKMPNLLKAFIILRYNASEKQAIRIFDNSFQTTQINLNIINEVLTFLLKAKYAVKNNHLVFSNTQDLDTYNKLIKSYLKISYH